MADDKDEKKTEDADELTTLDGGVDEDDDLAEVMGEESEGGEAVDIDAILTDIDPDFKKEMDGISSNDFKDASVSKEIASDEVDEGTKAPSLFRTFLKNLPKDRKRNYMVAAGVVALMLPLAALIYFGKILPRFELPFVVSMNELTKDVYTYPTDGTQVPLFDDFRTNSFTYALPKTLINLKRDGDHPSFGEFEFFLNLREKELAETIKFKQSKIIDLIQRSIEEITWRELQGPVGKERLKKMIRHRVNEFLQGNIVLGVYFRSVILQK